METKTLREKVKYFRKYLQTKLLIKNKSISRIFILNDNKSVEYLNSEFKTKVFQVLPDPVPVLNPLAGYSVRNFYNINAERLLLLHFGSLEKRKGIFEILDAFYHLSSNEISQIALLIFGKANQQMDPEIRDRIKKIERSYDQSLIIYHNDFVSASLMKSLFDQCDLVLIPYKNVETSSGIFGHAMASAKPVIGTNKGLLGEMITENNAGITIPDVKAIKIADAIRLFLKKKTDYHVNKKYITDHTGNHFAEVIIKKQQ